MEQIATSIYEQMEAKMNKNIKDAEAARLNETNCTEEKEIKKMENKYNKDYTITGKITSKVVNTICSVAVNYNMFPVDMGFKLNNLNDTEFRLYATKVMRYAMDNPFSMIEYATQKDHDKRFYDFRDKVKHLVDDSITAPIPAPQKDYHIPTDTEIRLKNDCDWKDLEIEHLKARLKKAAECYIAIRDFSTFCIDEYLEAGKQTRKGSDIIVK